MTLLFGIVDFGRYRWIYVSFRELLSNLFFFFLFASMERKLRDYRFDDGALSFITTFL